MTDLYTAAIKALASAQSGLGIGAIVFVVAAASLLAIAQIQKNSNKLRADATRYLFILALVAIVLFGVASFLRPSDNGKTNTPTPRPTTASLIGAVTDNNGQNGLSGASVTVQPLSDLPRTQRSTDTDGNFKFDFNDVPEVVEARIWASAPGHATSSRQTIEIDPAATHHDNWLIDLLPISLPSPPPQPVAAPTGGIASATAPHLPPAVFISRAPHPLPAGNFIALHPMNTPATNLLAARAFETLGPIHLTIRAIDPKTQTPVTTPANWNAFVASLGRNQFKLTNAATDSFGQGHYTATIALVNAAQNVAPTGLWRLSYPDLAASYYLSGDRARGAATLARMLSDAGAAQPKGSILASNASLNDLLESLAADRAKLDPPAQAAFDNASAQLRQILAAR